MQLTWLAGGGGGAAVEQGHRRQEQGHRCREPAAAGVGRCCQPWAGRRSAKQGRQKWSPAAAHYSAREEGTGSAGTLGEEGLWRPYVPPSGDWCVPH